MSRFESAGRLPYNASILGLFTYIRVSLFPGFD